MMKNTPNLLIIRPFQKGLKSNLVTLLAVVVLFLVFVYFNDNIEWNWTAMVILGFFVVYIGYFLVVLYPIQVVFDRQNKVIYRKYGAIFKVRLLSFAEATVLVIKHNYNGLYYSLANKNNRYKPLQKISYYLSEKESNTFEQETLLKIEEILGIKR
ncbi:MAG: hypothetical protein Q4C98_07720 [Capnocytophaga sp.]|nr:hypothetical protein [Capnocytophaga sp.]